MNRIVDRGAVFAGWVGIGTAVVLVISFGLVVPIQAFVYLLALPAGALLGWYANTRARRHRPRGRALGNALWAGAVTGLSVGIFYVGVRLLFIYADNGYPQFNRDPVPGQSPSPTCATGPACTYLRYLGAGRGPELEAAGVTDADSFARSIANEQLAGAGILFVLTVAGAAIAGGWRAVSPPPLEPEAAG